MVGNHILPCPGDSKVASAEREQEGADHGLNKR